MWLLYPIECIKFVVFSAMKLYAAYNIFRISPYKKIEDTIQIIRCTYLLPLQVRHCVCFMHSLLLVASTSANATKQLPLMRMKCKNRFALSVLDILSTFPTQYSYKHFGSSCRPSSVCFIIAVSISFRTRSFSLKIDCL